MFNGKDLTGWKVIGTERSTVQNGEIVGEASGARGGLRDPNFSSPRALLYRQRFDLQPQFFTAAGRFSKKHRAAGSSSIVSR